MCKKACPLVGIVIPVFNVEKYLPECFESLLSQTYGNFVAVLINDGSTDGSPKLCDDYGKQDARFKVIHKVNGGASSARNAGLDFLLRKNSDVEIVFFLDSDDLFLKNALEVCVREMANYKSDCVAFGWQSFDTRGVVPNSKNKADHPVLLSRNEAIKMVLSSNHKDIYAAGFLNNFAIRADLIKGLRFDLRSRVCQDLDYKVQALLRVSTCLGISDVLLHYRLRSGSLSHKNYVPIEDLFLYLKFKDSPYLSDFNDQIESRMLKMWWGGIRTAYLNGSLDSHWEDFKFIYRNMVSKFSAAEVCSCRQKRRFFLFRLGVHFVKFYFNIIKKPKKDENLAFYFE